MVRDDRFKRYQEAGVDFLEGARTRAEEFLEELAKVGDTTQKQAHGALDELVEGSRKGTEQLLAFIRKEITSQLSLLGIATKDDLAALERRLTERVGPAAGAAGRPTKKAAPDKNAASKKATAKKAPTQKTSAEPAAANTPPPKAAGEA